MTHVVMTSGGDSSAVTAWRVRERHGVEDLVLLFADTKGDNPSPHAGEDEDTYRFLNVVEQVIGVPVTGLNQGEDVWDVFLRRRRIGSGYAANCSFELKQKPAREWLDAHCDPAATTVYIGIDWTEEHRCEAQRQAYAHRLSGCNRPKSCDGDECRIRQGCRRHRPCHDADPCSARLAPDEQWRVCFPLIEWAPRVDKEQIHAQARVLGLPLQRLYQAGFPHANCGGFCVRAGAAQFELMLREHPDRYRYHEQREQDWRDRIGKDNAILNVTERGRTVPLTLRTFREQLEAQTALFDPNDFGGCGCFTQDQQEERNA